METLEEYLKDKKPKGFKPSATYSHDGNILNVYFENDRCFTERLSNVIDIYKSELTGEVVGCRIWGVKQLVSGDK